MKQFRQFLGTSPKTCTCICTNHWNPIVLTQYQKKMLKIFTTIASALEATLTARTPFAPPQKRVHHVATNLATEPRSFESICTPVRCTRKRDSRFFPEDEVSATIRYEGIPPTIHIQTSQIIHSPATITPTTSANPSPCPSPRTPFFHHHLPKRVHPTVDVEAARVHSDEMICTPVRKSRKGGNRFFGEVEIVPAVSKLPSKRVHGMVTRSMSKRLPVVFLSLP